jgi:uncharacterized protein YciU (UPF0263 family)
MSNFKVLGTLLMLAKLLLASDNGKYYVCDTAILESDNQCIFVLTGDQPDDWTDKVEHDINRDVGADFYRGVQSYDGETMLNVSPKPWVNGDDLVGSDEPITGDLWSGYALIFELMAPLRDMMMYNPSALTSDVWAKYTRALTDCNSKTVDARSGGSPFSTSQVYEYVKDPKGNDIHHFILQYLEEGSIDLVCLSTDLDMEHCDAMRELAGATKGVDRCNCWFDAYNALYGECPKFDMTFTTCPGTVAPVDCAGAEPTDTSNLETIEEPVEPEEPEEPVAPEQPTTPSMPAKGPKARRRAF